MSEPISSEFIKKVAADLNKNSAEIKGSEGPTDKLKSISLPNSIEGDAGNLYKPETFESSLEVSAKIHAVHKALAEKVGIKLEAAGVNLERVDGKDTYHYNTDATDSPDRIKEKLVQAAKDFEKMSPTELAKFSARVDAIHSQKEQKLEFKDSNNPKLQALFQDAGNQKKQHGIA